MRLKNLPYVVMLISILGMINFVAAQSLVDTYVAGFVTNKDGSKPGDNEVKYQGYLTNEPLDTTATVYCTTDSDPEKASWNINLALFDKAGESDKTWEVGDTLHVVFTNVVTGERNIFAYETLDPNVAGNPQIATEPFALPVEMVSFNAVSRDRSWGYEVMLDWKTASESNNLGFEIQRSLDAKTFEQIGFIAGAGSSATLQAYSFVDKDVTSGKYYYRLKQTDTDGTVTLSDMQEVTLAAPERYELGQNYPNPFNPATEIMFKVKEAGRVQVTVYDILGRQVSQLVDAKLNAGIHKVSFDGRALPSGMYLYVMKTAGYHEVKKMALIK